MDELISGLLLYPTFLAAPRGELEATAPAWVSRHLNPAEVLWRQGDPSDGLALVLRGELQVTVDGLELGRIGNGGIVGEVTAFFENGRRSATVVASEGTELALLSCEGLWQMRGDQPGVYAVLLEQALRALVRRVRAADRRITSLAPGGMRAPTRVEPGAMARMWRTLVPGLPKGSCPPVVPLLQKLTALADAPPSVLAAIGARFVPEAWPEGHLLFLEGEPADAAWIIAEGGIDILRHVRAERAERVATLGPGDLIGINTLIEAMPRTASGVTTGPTWLWRIPGTAIAQLQGEAALYWRESMLAALSTQIRLAHKALGRVSTGSRADATFGEDFDRLLHASGYLEGLPVDTSDGGRFGRRTRG